MYKINSTFDNARIGKTYKEGDVESLKELTNKEVDHLLFYSLVSVVDDNKPKLESEPENSNKSKSSKSKSSKVSSEDTEDVKDSSA